MKISGSPRRGERCRKENERRIEKAASTFATAMYDWADTPYQGCFGANSNVSS